jgi:hypothetical protein
VPFNFRAAEDFESHHALAPSPWQIRALRRPGDSAHKSWPVGNTPAHHSARTSPGYLARILFRMHLHQVRT